VPIPSPDDANFKKFLEIYQKYNPGETPSGFSTAGFIAGEIIVEAVKRAGQDLDREKLVAALETFNNFTGIQAQAITYGPVQRSGVTSLYMLKTENNTFVPLSKDRINLK
jgi:branched-chain amino acid transport system substrate-binding protein